MRAFLSVFVLSLSLAAAPAGAAADTEYDLVIYGGTSAAVAAAVQAKRMGKSVVIVSPDKHLGGLSSGGLGFTDTGNKSVIGGLANISTSKIRSRDPLRFSLTIRFSCCCRFMLFEATPA